MSAVRSTMDTTLPALTQAFGVPLVWPARTLLAEPVTVRKSTCAINSRVISLLTSGSICTRSRGAPILSSSVWMYRNNSSQVDAPLGEGATMTALRPFKAIITLLAGVAAGLVDGVTAPTTPTGLAIDVIPFSSSTLTTPTDIAEGSRRSRKVPSVLLVLVDL